jgi:hypothetical protein
MAAYAREELVAELGALLLGDRLEIGSAISHHAAYMEHWILLLRQSPGVLFRLLSEARRAADLIVAEESGLLETPHDHHHQHQRGGQGDQQGGGHQEEAGGPSMSAAPAAPWPPNASSSMEPSSGASPTTISC